eukprot:TRINITY_DN63950_c0_g1_i1.p1 TRINITY_DN63950_c0_g1~~TRINITY_DN63950_c0_g1_i1.p1  ORF type:complete len:750 (+),score=109.43 TRINITY_DN63950_c0_g1_i1:184-2433(+)
MCLVPGALASAALRDNPFDAICTSGRLRAASAGPGEERARRRGLSCWSLPNPPATPAPRPTPVPVQPASAGFAGLSRLQLESAGAKLLAKAADGAAPLGSAPDFGRSGGPGPDAEPSTPGRRPGSGKNSARERGRGPILAKGDVVSGEKDLRRESLSLKALVGELGQAGSRQPAAAAAAVVTSQPGSARGRPGGAALVHGEPVNDAKKSKGTHRQHKDARGIEARTRPASDADERCAMPPDADQLAEQSDFLSLSTSLGSTAATSSRPSPQTDYRALEEVTECSSRPASSRQGGADVLTSDVAAPVSQDRCERQNFSIPTSRQRERTVRHRSAPPSSSMRSARSPTQSSSMSSQMQRQRQPHHVDPSPSQVCSARLGAESMPESKPHAAGASPRRSKADISLRCDDPAALSSQCIAELPSPSSATVSIVSLMGRAGSASRRSHRPRAFSREGGSGAPSPSSAVAPSLCISCCTSKPAGCSCWFCSPPGQVHASSPKSSFGLEAPALTTARSRSSSEHGRVACEAVSTGGAPFEAVSTSSFPSRLRGESVSHLRKEELQASDRYIDSVNAYQQRGGGGAMAWFQNSCARRTGDRNRSPSSACSPAAERRRRNASPVSSRLAQLAAPDSTAAARARTSSTCRSSSSRRSVSAEQRRETIVDDGAAVAAGGPGKAPVALSRRVASPGNKHWAPPAHGYATRERSDEIFFRQLRRRQGRLPAPFAVAPASCAAPAATTTTAEASAGGGCAVRR